MTDPALTPLHVAVRGSTGSPVVMLHSGGMSSRQWRKLAEALEPTHRTAAPDFLGSGDNPLWPEGVPFDWKMDVAAVERVISGLGGKAHLIGHSYGGLVALTLARLHPDWFKSITVYDPVVMGVIHSARDPVGAEDLARVDDVLINVPPEQQGTEAWMSAFVDYWNGANYWRALPEATRAAFLRVSKKVSQEVLTLLADRTPLEAYRGLPPALLLSGEKSPPAAHRVGVLLESVMADAKREVLAGAGHMGPLTHLELTNRLIADHVRRNDG